MSDDLKGTPAAPRRLEMMDLDTLVEAPRNPKLHDAEALGSSIDRFGFVDLIVLDERTGRIVAGHGRRKALLGMKASGATPPDGIHIAEGGAWLVPVLRGWTSRSDAEAEAFLLADNRQAELGGWNDSLLLDALVNVQQGGGLAGVGFSDVDLEDLKRTVVPPPPTSFPAAPPGDGCEDVECPHCGHVWDGR